MDIKDIKIKKYNLENQIKLLVNNFETETDCVIQDIDYEKQLNREFSSIIIDVSVI